MSVNPLGTPRQDSLVPTSDVSTVAAHSGVTIPESELSDLSALLSGLNHSAKPIPALRDYTPVLNLCLYSRTNIHRPTTTPSTDPNG